MKREEDEVRLEVAPVKERRRWWEVKGGRE